MWQSTDLGRWKRGERTERNPKKERQVDWWHFMNNNKERVIVEKKKRIEKGKST